jgi:uncharacterized protein
MTQIKSALTRLLPALFLLVVGWPGAAPAQEMPQPRLPTVELKAGMHKIVAEVAKTPQQRSTGMMMRSKMAPHEAMLFVFETASPQCFWMRNTLLPLSIAFIADDGTVVQLADMTPRDDNSHCSAKPVRYALEMNQGWFASRGIKPGFRFSGGPFSAAVTTAATPAAASPKP